MIQFFDTRSQEKVEFSPREPGKVAMYACGPTPYDVPHMGHGRTALTYDLIRRYFEWRGFEVTYASNITDIEDKIIARAQEENSTEPQIVQRYEQIYWDQLDRLGVRRPTHVPRATEYITKMQELIGELIQAGVAYAIPNSGVYFSVKDFKNYGQLSHRKVEDLLESAGARVEIDEEKRSPIDFALWKAAKPGEPQWDSPWGAGRPGWHIECSAMSLDLLDENFDIHGGGADLVFPHHENEIAQAEGAGNKFARHWIHSAMLNVSGEKMSKSLGNFITLGEAIDLHGPRALRLLSLQTHYRVQMELGEESLAAASSALERLDALERSAQTANVPYTNERDQNLIDAFTQAMDDDFNAPNALAVVFEGVKQANKLIAAGNVQEAAPVVVTIRELMQVLGVPLEAGMDQDAEIDALIQKREQARAAKDFAEADRIRDELAAQGVILEDSPSGTVWHR